MLGRTASNPGHISFSLTLCVGAKLLGPLITSYNQLYVIINFMLSGFRLDFLKTEGIAKAFWTKPLSIQPQFNAAEN